MPPRITFDRQSLERRQRTQHNPEGDSNMAKLVTQDGTEIYYKDRGVGQPVTFSHGWPLTADAWEAQMFFLASHGYRCIAHDRRGHGRSSQPWHGNDMDTYADDVAELFDALDLKDAVMIVRAGSPREMRAADRWRVGRTVPSIILSPA
jgi:alpha-beta hydrolase superfamily lysophospholipase